MQLDLQEAPKLTPIRDRRRLSKYIIGAVILCAIGVAGGIAAAQFMTPVVRIDASVAAKAASPIYVPKQLPGVYTLVEDSFVLQEEALVFRADDGTGGRLLFTEQAKPPDFNFTQFYKDQFSDPQTISNAPYPSTWGKTINKESLTLSIVTDETWVLMTTTAPLGAEDLARIARSMVKHTQ